VTLQFDIIHNADLVLGFGLLVLAAALARVVTPKPRGWNSSRAATQRDVADVLAGRGKRDGRANEVITLAAILVLGVLFYVAIM